MAWYPGAQGHEVILTDSVGHLGHTGHAGQSLLLLLWVFSKVCGRLWTKVPSPRVYFRKRENHSF